MGPNILGNVCDDNLRLAVVDALMSNGSIPRFDAHAFRADGRKAARPLGLRDEKTEAAPNAGAPVAAPRDVDDEGEDEDVDSEEDDEYSDYRYCRPIARALLRVEASREMCATIKDLNWAAYSDAVYMIWTYFDGESDEFTIGALDGIDSLENLETFSLDYVCRVSDLSPLAGCTRLREVSLKGGGEVRDVAPLSSMTALRKLTLQYQDIQSIEPLVEIPLETLSLDDNKTLLDLTLLERIPTLTSFSWCRSVYRSDSTPPLLDVADNRRVLATLHERGVEVKVR